MHLSRSYDQVSVTYNLQMFNMGTVSKRSQRKMCNELHLGQLIIATVGSDNVSISYFSAEFCALLCVECLSVRQHTWLICVN
jgi:hypothetical protein